QGALSRPWAAGCNPFGVKSRERKATMGNDGRLHQLRNGLGARREQVLGAAALVLVLRLRVEAKDVKDGGHQVLGGDGVGAWQLGAGGGIADGLAHTEAAARQRE